MASAFSVVPTQATSAVVAVQPSSDAPFRYHMLYCDGRDTRRGVHFFGCRAVLYYPVRSRAAPHALPLSSGREECRPLFDHVGCSIFLCLAFHPSYPLSLVGC